VNIFDSNKNILYVSALPTGNDIRFFSCLGGIFRFYQNYSKKHKINISNVYYNNNYEPYLKCYLDILNQ
jgi:hypothetical protein